MLPDRGLSAGELALAIAELAPLVADAELVDVSGLRERDDLLLFLRAPDQRKLALHLVPGGTRGRICPTARRFAKPELALGPGVEALRNELSGARLQSAHAIPDERIAVTTWQHSDGRRLDLVVELFGNRGVWLLLGPADRILAMSRLVRSEGRPLELGGTWAAPRRDGSSAAAAPRFADLAAIDRAFTAADHDRELRELRDLCQRTLQRAIAGARARRDGLRHQAEQGAEATRLRAQADLMLAYAHTVRRGASSMRVPDPSGEVETLEIPLATDKPVIAQAQALYERARRLDDARTIATQRAGAAEQELVALEALASRAGAIVDFASAAALRDDLLSRRLLREAPSAPTRAKPQAPAREAYRRFVSTEGYEILCGKTNEQNDRLTLRTARGNDVWLHVGRGHAGSHVVVRLPKGKTASLETLLDAATIAVHFSKARGADKAEVIYTLAKHVRKQKGAPAGAVIPHQTKTLAVRIESARLQRLLDSGTEP